jgi:hypothetical protein
MERPQQQQQPNPKPPNNNVLGPAPTGAKEGATGKYGGKPFKIVNGQMVIQG